MSFISYSNSRWIQCPLGNTANDVQLIFIQKHFSNRDSVRKARNFFLKGRTIDPDGLLEARRFLEPCCQRCVRSSEQRTTSEYPSIFSCQLTAIACSRLVVSHPMNPIANKLESKGGLVQWNLDLTNLYLTKSSI